MERNLNQEQKKNILENYSLGRNGLFMRIEDKAFLSFEKFNDLIYKLDEKMEFFPSQMIKSVYFDSPELHCFKTHMEKSPQRFKVRIRHYRKKKGFKFLLELKEKENGVTKKTRIEITEKDKKRIFEGKKLELSKSLEGKNKKIVNLLEDRVEMINGYLSKFDLKPILVVQYRRTAFESSDFRVTMDENLRGNTLEYFSIKHPSLSNKAQDDMSSLLDKYQDQCTILEIKHKGTFPEWFNSLYKNHELKKVSFSKYCYFISKKLVEIN